MKAAFAIPAHLLLVPCSLLHAAETPPAANPPDETWATLAIDTAAPSVPYSPMIFGGFLEHFHTQIYGGKLRHGSASVPVADAIATVDESGRQWTIALVSRHPQNPVACTLKMKGDVLGCKYAALILSGDSPDAFNDMEIPTGSLRGRPPSS